MALEEVAGSSPVGHPPVFRIGKPSETKHEGIDWAEIWFQALENLILIFRFTLQLQHMGLTMPETGSYSR